MSNDDIDGLIEADLTANPNSTFKQMIVRLTPKVRKSKLKHWIVKKAFKTPTTITPSSANPKDWATCTYQNP